MIIIKAKYYVIEPYYMEGSTPDGPVVFSGSCLLLHFPKTSDNKNEESFREAIDCALKILDSRYSINFPHLSPFDSGNIS